MTVETLKQQLSLETLVGGNGLEKPVTGGYCGDLLSWVISKAPAESAWITVMGNENAIAVATLADISCIILAENSELDKKAETRAKENSIAVFRSAKSVYALSVELSKALEISKNTSEAKK